MIFHITMAYSLNNIHLIGNLTEKAELRQTPSGKSVTDLNLQVKIKFRRRDNGEVQISTSYHTVVLWGKQAEIADQYLRAGSQVYVAGRLKTEEWEGEDKQKRRKTKIVAREIILLDSRTPLPGLAENSLISGGLNEATIIGNLTRDPELRQTPSGENVCNFGVATNRRWQGSEGGEMQEETEFHNIVVWGELAREVGEKIKKGQKVYISGSCNTRSWETPDGDKRYTTEINADKVLILGLSSPLGEGGAAAMPADGRSEELPDIPEISHESEIRPEDLPF